MLKDILKLYFGVRIKGMLTMKETDLVIDITNQLIALRDDPAAHQPSMYYWYSTTVVDYFINTRREYFGQFSSNYTIKGSLIFVLLTGNIQGHDLLSPNQQ